ncbi:hypothetical protein ACQV2C_01345 [Pantoea allii]|uniref:hypothetical protein n=1 Tax=Pantoea allii TaxID=574096 RepID=UPI003D3236FA
MKTPAYKPFIKAVGKTVHHLNTVAVGLAGIESGHCSKPKSLDVSWNPNDVRASSRDARLFMLRATIVFAAEEICTYNSIIIGSPNIGDIRLPKDPNRGDKHLSLAYHLKMTDTPLVLGPLLLIHWRNKIIHKKSNASLTISQVEEFKNHSSEIKEKYKNLSVDKLINDFHVGLPTLKDVSSLIAMTINYVNAVENLIPEPQSKDDFENWLKYLGLSDSFERARRVSASKINSKNNLDNFIRTECPELWFLYKFYYP